MLDALIGEVLGPPDASFQVAEVRYTSNQVRREADGGPVVRLATFRAVQARRSAPPGPGETVLRER